MRARNPLYRGSVIVLLVALFLSMVPGPANAALDGAGTVTIPDNVPTSVSGGAARLVGPASQSQDLHLVIGLQPPRLAQEEQFLRALQTWGSPLYHRYLTPAQWNTQFAPSATDEQQVVDWAVSQGLTVTERFPNRLTVGVHGSAAVVGRALGVQINSYQLRGAAYYSNDRDPSIPTNLAGIVHSIAGLNNVDALESNLRVSRPASGPATSAPASTPASAPAASTAQTVQLNGDSSKRPTAGGPTRGQGAPGSSPDLMSGLLEVSDLYTSQAYSVNALYNQGHCCNPFHSPSTGAPNTSSVVIVTACDVDISSNGDLINFANQYGRALNTTTVPVDGGPSGNNNCANTNGGLNTGLETTLDVEVANAMANSFGCYCDTAQVFVYEAPSSTPNKGNPTFGFSDNITAWQNALNDDHARSASESWGCTEKTCWSTGNMDTMHNIFNQMLGQGWTVSIAAGDNGAFDNGTSLSVQYPAVDPDVVAAGGTVLSLDSSGNFSSEVAWNGGAGGCSTYYTAPFYQTTYTTSNGATQNFTNPCGSGSRSIPDISLNAGGSQAEYFNGGWTGVVGTSIVAPEFAGLFANENAYLMTLGNDCGSSASSSCAPLGQANQWIYFEGSEPNQFAPHNPYYDTTSGCNNGPLTSGGFCAGTGFDNATGWGSFDALQFAWMFNWQQVFTDNHPPVVSYTTTNPPGWYNSDQSINFTITDPIRGSDLASSGVSGYTAQWDSAPGDPSSESTPGTGNVFWNGPGTIGTIGQFDLASQGQGCHTPNVRAWDNQGQDSGDQTTGAYCYDITPPQLTCPAADGLWHAANVSLVCTASDSLSGLANSSDSSFSLSTNVPAGVETNNASTSSHQVCDVAGNCLTAGPIGGNRIDRKAPSMTITTPAATNYTLNQSVLANYGCSDGGSGVATCVGTVANGSKVNTGSVGGKSFSVSSTDNVGNASGSSVNYNVTYNICLTYNPSQVKNSGSTYPFTLKLCDVNGINVSSSAITLTAVSTTPSEPLASNSNPGNMFRFDPTTQQYVYNLSTKGYPAGSYVLNFTVSGDPITHSAAFILK
jgi:hypothetical protein